MYATYGQSGQSRYEDLTPEQQIASVLGIPDDDGWYITDSRPATHLYMIHPRDKDNYMIIYGSLRGLVVDIYHRTIVARSYGYNPVTVANKITPDKDGNVDLVNVLGDKTILPNGKYDIKPGYDGVYVRIFLHANTVYIASHRKLDMSASKWGNSLTFKDMYNSLGGPSGDELFPQGQSYSPYVHGWMIVNPDVANVTKAIIGPGYLVYLGVRQEWEHDMSPYYQDDSDTTLWIPPNITNDPNKALNQGYFLVPPRLSLEEANHKLLWGEYPPFDMKFVDPRLGTGEFVVIYIYDDNNQVEKLIRVESTAYKWRIDMRNNNPNLKHQFFMLSNMANIDTSKYEGLLEFQEHMPIVSKFDRDEMKKELDKNDVFVTWPRGKISPLLIRSWKDRLYNIWACFFISVPLHHQKEVFEFYDDFFKQRDELIAWINNIYDELDDLKNLPEVSPSDRITVLIKEATKGATNVASKSKTNKLTIKQLVHRNIKNFIYKEEGSSLYRQIRIMEKTIRRNELDRLVKEDEEDLKKSLIAVGLYREE